MCVCVREREGGRREREEDAGLTLYLCLCVSAKGPVFSSGHDLKELTSAQGRDYHTKVFHTCAEVSLYHFYLSCSCYCFPVSHTMLRSISA